ncbi:D-alanyl-D-alanine carboxypeptidase family protein [Qipengyuania sp. DGS5-3]|uniref:D-alanyl-D-alanine carboxypeptidase family protein n=1 Tax=Qipengyuania sp. DGS5-3 TaxID=3349632 RepID=UPI0036D37CA0
MLVFSAAYASAVLPAASAREAPQFDVPEEDVAPIALMVEMNTGQVLFSREADRRFIPASMTKVMTAFLAFEKLEDQSLNLTDQASVSPEAFEQWSRVGSTMFLPADGAPTVAELLLGVTTISANDGAIVLAEHGAGSVEAWVAQMNKKATELGMENSWFGTPNGWMDGGKTFTTANDLSKLATALITRHPAKYEQFFGQRTFRYNGIAQRNYDPITGFIPGADGIKTGYTDQAGNGFLGSAIRDGRRLIMVVGGSPSTRSRADVAREFIEWGFAQFASRPIFSVGEQIGTARVQGGAQGRVALVANQAVTLALPAESENTPEISLKIRYEGPVRAPIASGDELADLVVMLDGEQVSTVPLVAQSDVREANVFERIVNAVMGWFA